MDAGLEHALKTAKLLKEVNPSSFIVLADENGSIPERTQNAGRIQPQHCLNTEQWKTFSSNADNVAKSVMDETGLRTVFHHHCAGYIETPNEVKILLNETNSDCLGLCFDTGHFEYGGGNALEGLKTCRERIWHVHFKDCSTDVKKQAAEHNWDYFEAVKNGVFCELGKGSVDFPAVLQHLRDTGYEGWIVVEQDVLPGMGSPFESAKRNREYLKTIGL
jgi:inosose dehydratase